MISIQNVTDPNDPKTWTFHLFTSWLKDKTSIDESQGLLEAMRKAGEYMAEPFRSALIWLPDGAKVWKNKIQYWVPVPWDNRGGRVTLAGDTAHPMLPYRGQGFNHCLCDAAKLVEQLTKIQSKSQLSEAISMYEAEMIPRGKAEVESAVENAYMIHDGEKLMESPLMKSGAAKTS